MPFSWFPVVAPRLVVPVPLAPTESPRRGHSATPADSPACGCFGQAFGLGRMDAPPCISFHGVRDSLVVFSWEKDEISYGYNIFGAGAAFRGVLTSPSPDLMHRAAGLCRATFSPPRRGAVLGGNHAGTARMPEQGNEGRQALDASNACAAASAARHLMPGALRQRHRLVATDDQPKGRRRARSGRAGSLCRRKSPHRKKRARRKRRGRFVLGGG